MKPFIEALEEIRPKLKKRMCKYFIEAGISDWTDFTKEGLYDFYDTVMAHVSPNSAATMFAAFKVWLGRYEDRLPLPLNWRKILSVRVTPPVKTFLTHQELNALARVQPRNDFEKTVLYTFLVSARTGMRISDTRSITTANIARDGDRMWLDYISKKTKTHAQVPISKKTVEMAEWVQEHGVTDYHLWEYNDALRLLCYRAGIRTQVEVLRAGKPHKGEKWLFVSSHTARTSFCTNLAIAGVPVVDIAQLAGHSNYNMTLRYIAVHQVKLPESARVLFDT